MPYSLDSRQPLDADRERDAVRLRLAAVLVCVSAADHHKLQARLARPLVPRCELRKKLLARPALWVLKATSSRRPR
jgi:hypothetical protein